ncbi:MAG: hypothetical protein QXI54_08320 [Archaeoglobaceae archaeon]
MEAVWIFKVRKMRSGSGKIEKVIRIPREVEKYFNEFAEIRISNNGLLISPLKEQNFKITTESDNPSSQEVS